MEVFLLETGKPSPYIMSLQTSPQVDVVIPTTKGNDNLIFAIIMRQHTKELMRDNFFEIGKIFLTTLLWGV